MYKNLQLKVIDSHIKISIYLKDLINLRKKFVKVISLILHMNETRHYFFHSYFNCAFLYKGVKQVVVSTQDQEK